MALNERPVVIVGAGAAGLGTAATLQKRGLPAVVLDREAEVASAWRHRYDSLSLNTSRYLSRLSAFRHKRGQGHWMSRDEFVSYLEEYVNARDIDLLLETEVERIDRSDHLWRVETSRGPMFAHSVVVAAGQNCVPRIPPWPGLEGFTGEFLHSSQYRNAGAYRGRSVLVVGSGDSAADAALDATRAGAAQVWMAVRTPPYIVLAHRRGIPPDWLGLFTRRMPTRVGDRLEKTMRRITVGDLTDHGLPTPERGFYTNFWETHDAPIIDRRGYVKALKQRRFEIVAAVEAFDGDEVMLADGPSIRPDVVIAATGYHCGLDPLVGHLGVLDDRGRPTAAGDRTHPSAPDLYFIGYTDTLGGHIREMRLEAGRIARAIERRVRSLASSELGRS